MSDLTGIVAKINRDIDGPDDSDIPDGTTVHYRIRGDKEDGSDDYERTFVKEANNRWRTQDTEVQYRYRSMLGQLRDVSLWEVLR